MELVVFGANGPTGRQVVRQALNAGHTVFAVTRNPDGYPISARRLTVARADVTDREQVAAILAAAMPGAVISTFGVPYSRRPVTVYSRGMANVIAGMRSCGTRRLVCVSSTTVAEGDAPGESLFWRRVLIPVLRGVVGRTLYDDMRRMERAVEASGLNWTIVRPGGLFDTDDPTRDPQVSTGRLRGRMTSRADLAHTLLVEAIRSQHSRATIEVITRSQLPTVRSFVRDTFGPGR